jgi:hypothetical protein
LLEPDGRFHRRVRAVLDLAEHLAEQGGGLLMPSQHLVGLGEVPAHSQAL